MTEIGSLSTNRRPSPGRWHYSHLLPSRCHFVSTSLRFINDTLWAVINGPLVPFVDWYQNVYYGHGMISLSRRSYWKRSDNGGFDEVCYRPGLDDLIMASIRRIRWPKGSVRIQICLFIARYIFLEELGTLPNQSYAEEFVVRFCLIIQDCSVRNIPVVLQVVLLKQHSWISFSTNLATETLKNGKSIL